MRPNVQADREAVVRWARDLLEHGGWVIVDAETTGLDHRAEAVQIAVVDATGLPLFNRLIRPTRPIPAIATEIHGITDAMVCDAHDFKAVAWLLYPVLKDTLIVCYNAGFDRRILQQSARAHLIDFPEFAWHCAMEEYARYVGEWDDYRRQYRWQKLPHRPEQAALKHTALGDCWATLELIKRMAEGG